MSAAQPRVHRDTTLARREALLRAALEIVAERGVAGAKHREIAARAGLPLSTTSYFFASIDELVVEALRFFVAEGVARLDAVTSAIGEQDISADEAVDALVGVLVSIPAQETVAQFEAYLEFSRRPEMRGELDPIVGAFERLARAGLEAAGAHRTDEGARAFVALVDGFALHRVARPRGTQDAEDLRAALRSLFIAYAMSDAERAAWDERLARGG